MDLEGSKHRLLLFRILLGVFTVPLPSNRRPIVALSRGNVFTEPLRSNESIRPIFFPIQYSFSN
jgi:hypothetical protein